MFNSVLSSPVPATEAEKPNTSQRIAAIDIARGIAIVLVFVGHIALTPKVMKIWLQSFHIPLFFICSGLVFSTKKTPSFKQFFFAQVKSLVIPLFLLGILLFFLKCSTELLDASLKNIPVKYSWNLKDVLISLLLGYRRHKRYFSLWFLAALFFGKILFYFITKLFKQSSAFYLAVSVPLVFLQWFVLKYIKGFYWSLDLVPSCLAFLSVGYFFKISKFKDRLYSFKLFPVMVLLSLFFAFLNYKVNDRVVGLYSCYIGNPIYYYLGAVIGSWMVLIYSHFLSNNKILEFFGKHSLVLYAFNNSFAIPLAVIIIKYFAQRHTTLSDSIAQWLFIVTFALLICSLLAWIIDRFFPWIIGKKKSNGLNLVLLVQQRIRKFRENDAR